MAFGNDYGIKKSIKKCIYVSLIFSTLAGLIFVLLIIVKEISFLFDTVKSVFGL